MRRIVFGVTALTVAALFGACSSDSASSDDRTFCGQASAFQLFQKEAVADLADPERAPDFLAVSIEQLGVLADLAPDEARADVEAVGAGFERLDEQLAAVDYDLVAILASSYEDAVASDASDRLDETLAVECGLLAADRDLNAPFPFTPEELRVLTELEVTDPDRVVIDQLVGSVGLTEPQAQCLVDALGDDAVPLLLGGAEPSESAVAAFGAALEDCAIDPEELS